MGKNEFPRIGFLTDPGQVKAVNTDQVFSANLDYGTLLFLADGLGEQESQAMASQLALDTVLEVMKSAKVSAIDPRSVAGALQKALIEANTVIWAEGQKLDAPRPFGTSVALAIVLQQELYIAYSGSVNVTIVRRGVPNRVTRDYSAADQSDAAAAKVPRPLGLDGRLTPAVSSAPIPLETDDLLIFASDGIYESVTDSELADLSSNNPAEVACIKTIDLANSRGGEDNLTILVFQNGPTTQMLNTGTVKLPVQQISKGQAGASKWGWLALAGLLVAGIAVALFVLKPWRDEPPPVKSPTKAVAKTPQKAKKKEAKAKDKADVKRKGKAKLEVKDKAKPDAKAKLEAVAKAKLKAKAEAKVRPKAGDVAKAKRPSVVSKKTPPKLNPRDRLKERLKGSRGQLKKPPMKPLPRAEEDGKSPKKVVSSVTSKGTMPGVKSPDEATKAPESAESSATAAEKATNKVANKLPANNTEKTVVVDAGKTPPEKTTEKTAEKTAEKAPDNVATKVAVAPTQLSPEERCNYDDLDGKGARYIKQIRGYVQEGLSKVNKGQGASGARKYMKAKWRIDNGPAIVKERCQDHVNELSQALIKEYVRLAVYFKEKGKCNKARYRAKDARLFGVSEETLKQALGECYEEPK